MNIQTTGVFATALLLGLLAACGSGTDSTQVAGGGTGGTGSPVTGTITGFGSIFVNGIEFDTSSAAVSMDGFSADELDLDHGMVVTVIGTVDADGINGTAQSVSFSDALEGPVSAALVTRAAGSSLCAAESGSTLTVLGQTVLLDGYSHFQSEEAGVTCFEDIRPDDIVEVSGFGDGHGTVYATHVRVRQRGLGGESFELKGVISQLDSTNSRFNIGELVIDYSAVPAGSRPDQPLVGGLYVQVHGIPTGGGFSASEIAIEGDGDIGIDAEEGDEVELEGVVTSDYDSALGSFSLNGQVVSTSAETDRDGLTGADLIVGARIEVEGSYVNGVLVAEELERRGSGSETEYEGYVQAVDGAAGTLSVQGQTFIVTTSTSMEDDTVEGDRYFSLAELTIGHYVVIKAYDDGSGQLIATKVVLVDPPTP